MHALLKPMNQKNSDLITHPVLTNENPILSEQVKNHLLTSHRQQFDTELGGPKSLIKFLDRDSVEYSLLQASLGNNEEAQMAIKTLNRSLSLIDPVWGGSYQYSTADWQHPHHSKTMANQAGNIRIYALAYALFNTESYLQAARSIRDYLAEYLLSENNCFYAGQMNRVDNLGPIEYFSLNDQERKKHGVPSIDKNIYSRENGWAIEALACLHEHSTDEKALTMALNAAHYIILHLAWPDGGFKKSKSDAGAPRLADTLAMGRAMLQLFRVTQQEKWLIHAINAADFISLHFKHRCGGYISHIQSSAQDTPRHQIDENISLMRFCNLLTHYSGLRRHRLMAKHCLRYLSIDSVAKARADEAGILLANSEYLEFPLYISVFGEFNQAETREMLRSGLNHFGWYKCIRLYHSFKSIQFDSFRNSRNKPAAYVHNSEFESAPIRSCQQLDQTLTSRLQ